LSIGSGSRTFFAVLHEWIIHADEKTNHPALPVVSQILIDAGLVVRFPASPGNDTANQAALASLKWRITPGQDGVVVQGEVVGRIDDAIDRAGKRLHALRSHDRGN
jgi:hypothetical protein